LETRGVVLSVATFILLFLKNLPVCHDTINICLDQELNRCDGPRG
jgi:hypothetical protein